MKYPMYSYRDLKTGFGVPHCEMNDPAAIRSFKAALEMDSGVMSFMPPDFDLYKVGYFDMDTGMIEADKPELVCSGASVVKV